MTHLPAAPQPPLIASPHDPSLRAYTRLAHQLLLTRGLLLHASVVEDTQGRLQTWLTEKHMCMVCLAVGQTNTQMDRQVGRQPANLAGEEEEGLDGSFASPLHALV